MQITQIQQIFPFVHDRIIFLRDQRDLHDLNSNKNLSIYSGMQITQIQQIFPFVHDRIIFLRDQRDLHDLNSNKNLCVILHADYADYADFSLCP